MRFFVLVFSITTALGAIYKSVDDQGNITYRDKPSSGAVEVPLLDEEHQPNEWSNTAYKTAYRILIEEPVSGSTFSSDVNTIGIRVRVTPRLHDGDKLQLLHNGKPRGELQRKYRFDIMNLPRGTHHFAVAIVGKNNTIRAKTDGIVVYQQRSAVYSPLKGSSKSTQSP